MKIKTLIKSLDCEVEVRGSRDVEVTGIIANSRVVAPGNLFVARRGESFDGNEFIPEAIAAGAHAILTDIYNPFLDVTQVIVAHVLECEAVLAKQFYDSPDEKLFMIGITGTNGKTTTGYILADALPQAGMMGTIENRVGSKVIKSQYTTPEVSTNYKYLHEMLQSGCEYAVMEVTSHAIVQKRVLGIDFDVGIFLNLTHEHLDYHKTMDAYFEAKASFIRGCHKALINIDDPYGKKLAMDCKGALTFGATGDLCAKDVDVSLQGICATVYMGEQKAALDSQLIGRFNLSNLLAAIGALCLSGVSLKEATFRVSRFKGTPGRLERVGNRECYVDFAHTPDALKNAIESLRELSSKRLIVVFGCGGLRDREKRSKMGLIASQLADQVVITSDNPRTEKPEEIIAEIVSGVKDSKKLIIEPDRQKALEKGVDLFKSEESILLVCGKGHETGQIIGETVREFSDIDVLRHYFHDE
jgi:UDP-N-acetylmuramoyl-L-alanyl-D-glutamate--2,6-diaminopimelate ligase